MGVLEQVIGMKKQGFSDTDVASELSRNGISPREISEALKQAQIKSAVSDDDYAGAGMESSIMGNDMEVPSPSPSQNQVYQQEEYTPQEPQYTPQQPEYAPQEETQQYYQPGGYEQYAPSPTAVDTDTIMEISGQIFSDRIKKFQEVLDATSEAAILLQSKFENVSERLKKIETTIDKLQLAILEKVGSYGHNLESIKKEMSMMGDSFSKMISHSREPRHQSEEETETKNSSKKK